MEDIYVKYNIDKTKLKRDYIEQPLQKSLVNGHWIYEEPEKEDLDYLYNEVGLLRLYISKYFHISAHKVDKWLKKFGIEKQVKPRNDITYEQFGIDKSKLKRDYIQFPLHCVVNPKTQELKTELPFKEDLEYLYIDLNIRKKDIALFFGISISMFENMLKEFPLIRKTVQNTLLNTEKTCREKYGEKMYLCTVDGKKKAKETCIKKYGVDKYSKSDEFKKRFKETVFNKFGVDSPMKNEKCKEKARLTCQKKYGTDFHQQSEEWKNKIKKIWLEKEGVTCGLLSKHCRDVFYNKYHTNNINYIGKSEKSLDILFNKEKLIEYIKVNNIHNMSELGLKLGFSSGTMNRYCTKYDIKNLFDYVGSIPELEVRNYINQYYKTVNNSKKYLNGKEIDIYIPDLKIGIEFNGNFWHNEYGKTRLYHQEKSKLAEENGIFLYHIFEYEWLQKKELILNQLNNLLGINQTKISARKCIIKEVSNDDKEQFLIKNHLQGNDSSSVKLGLYHNEKLVSIMTFCKPRFNKKYEWELSRFCSLAGCNVVGGASKLFNHFIKTYNPKSIISYSNIAHTRGNLYKTLGFELNSISDPNYVWCDDFKILTRYQCQKHKLLEQGFEGISETEIMKSRGYNRIYDCGNKVWTRKIN